MIQPKTLMSILDNLIEEGPKSSEVDFFNALFEWIEEQCPDHDIAEAIKTLGYYKEIANELEEAESENEDLKRQLDDSIREYESLVDQTEKLLEQIKELESI
jgi:hypothetical protein